MRYHGTLLEAVRLGQLFAGDELMVNASKGVKHPASSLMVGFGPKPRQGYRERISGSTCIRRSREGMPGCDSLRRNRAAEAGLAEVNSNVVQTPKAGSLVRKEDNASRENIVREADTASVGNASISGVASYLSH